MRSRSMSLAYLITDSKCYSFIPQLLHFQKMYRFDRFPVGFRRSWEHFGVLLPARLVELMYFGGGAQLLR